MSTNSNRDIEEQLNNYIFLTNKFAQILLSLPPEKRTIFIQEYLNVLDSSGFLNAIADRLTKLLFDKGIIQEQVIKLDTFIDIKSTVVAIMYIIINRIDPVSFDKSDPIYQRLLDEYKRGLRAELANVSPARWLIIAERFDRSFINTVLTVIRASKAGVPTGEVAKFLGLEEGKRGRRRIPTESFEEFSPFVRGTKEYIESLPLHPSLKIPILPENPFDRIDQLTKIFNIDAYSLPQYLRRYYGYHVTATNIKRVLEIESTSRIPMPITPPDKIEGVFIALETSGNRYKMRIRDDKTKREFILEIGEAEILLKQYLL